MKMERQNINMKPRILILIPILIIGLGVLPKAQALSPAPDGGYPGGNTAEGQNALFSLTTGELIRPLVGFVRSGVEHGYAGGTLFSTGRKYGHWRRSASINTIAEHANGVQLFTIHGAPVPGALFSNTTGDRQYGQRSVRAL